MSKSCVWALVGAGAMVAAGVERAEAQDASPLTPIEPLATQIVAQVNQPLWVGSPPGDRSRLFVLTGSRDGADGVTPLYVLSITRPASGPPVYTRLTTPFLLVPAAAARSIAFAPDYATSGYLYVAHEANLPGSGHGSQITRYQRSATNPDIADPASATVIMRFPGTYFDHAVGSMHFGGDGYLYIGVGDWAGDPQAASSINGKILRINVTPGVDDFPADAARNYGIPPGNPYPISTAANAPRPEVLHAGLRNPWRWSFDRATGDMWIGDVGEGQVEEIDVVRSAGVGTPLWNFMWPRKEGTRAAGNGYVLAQSREVKPLISYPHIQQTRRGDELRGYSGQAVTGGVVYRGSALPSMRGRYLFCDSFPGWMATVPSAAPTVTPVNIAPMLARLADGTPTSAVNFVVSFGEDSDGEVYFCEYNAGRVRKIVPLATPPGLRIESGLSVPSTVKEEKRSQVTGD